MPQAFNPRTAPPTVRTGPAPTDVPTLRPPISPRAPTRRKTGADWAHEGERAGYAGISPFLLEMMQGGLYNWADDAEGALSGAETALLDNPPRIRQGLEPLYTPAEARQASMDEYNARLQPWEKEHPVAAKVANGIGKAITAPVALAATPVLAGDGLLLAALTNAGRYGMLGGLSGLGKGQGMERAEHMRDEGAIGMAAGALRPVKGLLDIAKPKPLNELAGLLRSYKK